MAELRSRPRARCDLEVAFEVPGRQLFLPARDVSASGIYLCASDPPALGEHVRVVVSLPPDGVFLRLHGRVVRHAGPNEAAGFGVRFEALDGRSMQALGSFVERAEVARS